MDVDVIVGFVGVRPGEVMMRVVSLPLFRKAYRLFAIVVAHIVVLEDGFNRLRVMEA